MERDKSFGSYNRRGVEDSSRDESSQVAHFVQWLSSRMELPKSVGIGLLVFTIACLCLAITIGLSLHYAIPRTIDYVQRTDTVGNCLPETTIPDETNCTARRYNTVLQIDNTVGPTNSL